MNFFEFIAFCVMQQHDNAMFVAELREGCIELPEHFATGESPSGHVARSDNSPDDNPVTNDGATLGRVLFYDVALSRNDSVSARSFPPY